MKTGILVPRRPRPAPLTRRRCVNAGPVVFAVLAREGREHVERCLATLERFTQIPHSVLVLDSGSRDDTSTWLRELSQRHIHPFASPVDLGIAGGRNALLELALPHLSDDDFVVFVDGAVEFTHGWASRILDVLKGMPQVGIAGVAGHAVVVSEAGRVLLPSPARTAPVDVVAGGLACWVRARAARQIGEFDEEITASWLADEDYCVRALSAGWEVFALPESRVFHREHGHGPALVGRLDGEERAARRHLATKWRESGRVDQEGWIRRARPRFYLDPGQREELRERLGWARRIERSELGAALWDLERLTNAADASAELNERPFAPTDLHYALVEMRSEMGGSDVARWQTCRGHLDRASAAARRACERVVLPTERDPATRFNKVCDVGDWRDEAWLATARALFDNDPGAGDVRRRQVWEATQVLHGLRRLGAIREDAVGLSVGSGAEVLLWHLPHHVRMLIATDLYDQAAEQEFGVPADMPARILEFADPGFPVDRLRVLEMDAQLLQFASDRFDFVYSVGALQHLGGMAAASRALAEMARVVKPGGIVAIATDVMVVGSDHVKAFTASELGSDLFATHGLSLVEPFDPGLDPDTRQGWAPGTPPTPLISESLRRPVTSAVVFLRKDDTTARSPVEDVGTRAKVTIGIDARTFQVDLAASRGVGQYTQQHLVALAAARPDWRFVCYGREHVGRVLRDLTCLPNVEHAPIDSFEGSVELMHVPDPMNLSRGFDAPFRVFRHARTTATCHDVIPLRCYWKTWSAEDRAVYLERLHELRRSGCTILANSVHTRSELLQALQVEPDRVEVIQAGVTRARPEDALDTDAINALRDRLGIRGPFFLHVGSLDDHRNFDGVLAAFAVLRASTPCQLVVVGPTDDNARRHARQCRERGPDGVVFAGFLPRAELEVLYCQAAALLMLPFHEGFGMAAVEAMALGCPVLCSNTSALPEVVGDAAVSVSPRDQTMIVRAMGQVLRDPGRRQQMIVAGRERASRFTWQRVAERTLAVWQRMLAKVTQ